MIHLHLLLTHNAKLNKFINWKEVRNTKFIIKCIMHIT